MILGILCLLNNFEIVDFGMNLIWPFVIILIGFSILRHGIADSGRSSIESDRIDISAILGGGDFKYSSRKLNGGKVFAFMGGAKIDLREAVPLEDSMVVDVFALMGGVEIIIPENWHVTMHGVPVLGGMENKTAFRRSDDTTGNRESATVNFIVKGTAIMGGIEVKN